MNILSLFNIKKSYLVMLIFISLVGIFMRSYAVERRALHNDESLQLNGICTGSFDGVIKHCLSVDFHPPLSYLIQQQFYRIKPTNTFARYASVFAGIFIVPLAFWAFRKLFDDRISIIISALTAISYELIWYSRELRCYIFFYLFTVMAFGFFIRLLKSPENKLPVLLFLGFIICNVLSFYFHYNTMLLWPIYGLLFVLYEIMHLRNRSFRWKYFWGMSISACVILILSSFAIPLILKWKWLFNMQVLRPSMKELWLALSPMGFGIGWRGAIWLALLLIGTYRCFRLSKSSFLIIVGWIILPIVMYLYAKGMSDKFVHATYRYMLFLQLGFIVLMACGIEQISLWIVGEKEKLANYVTGAVIFCIIIIMFPIFHAYYGLTATDRLYKEIGEALNKIAPRVLFLDNYYEMQHLRHYLPDGMPVAFPPIFNNNNEYQKMDIHGFTERVLVSDPMLVFYDAGNLRRRSKSSRSVAWLDKIYKHSKEFINKPGLYLYHRNMNLFPMNDMDKRIDRIYYNNIDDLPDIFDENKNEKIAFGPEWYGLTIMGFDGKWQFLRVAGETGTLFFDGNKKDAELKMSGCAAGQVITAFYDKKQIFKHDLSSRPLTGVELRSRKQFRQYIPLTNLLKQYNGVLNLPIAVNIPFDSVKFDLKEEKNAKIRKVIIKSNKIDGMIVSEK